MFKFLRDFGSPIFSNVILRKYKNFSGFSNRLPYLKHENYASDEHIFIINK